MAILSIHIWNGQNGQDHFKWKCIRIGVWLQPFGIEMDEMSVWLQTISCGNECNVSLGKNPFWMEIIENECLDENHFERFPFYTTRGKKFH